MQHNSRHGHAGFTLIEMLAVIAIIAILATILVASMGYVQEKEARSKTELQLGLLQAALQEYHHDNGSFPATENSATGEKNSHILFNALYWDPEGDGRTPTTGATTGEKGPTRYRPDLDPLTNKQGWTSGKPSARTKIFDPWGNEYRYISSKNSSGKRNSSINNPAEDSYDLWSVGKDGKTNPASPKDKVNNDDIWVK